MNFTKASKALWLESIRRANAFCQINGLREPHIIAGSSTSRRNNGASNFGQWCYGTIKVDVAGCFLDERIATQEDESPYGVLMHELGHHWSYIKGRKKTAVIQSLGEPISAYERSMGNAEEAVAETFMLFVTNPDRLRRMRPARFHELIGLGLKTIEDRTDDEVKRWTAQYLS